MVEGTTLERWHTRKGIEGSNPSLSVLGNRFSTSGVSLGYPEAHGYPRKSHAHQSPSRHPQLHEFTDESLFWNRRTFLKAAGLGAAAAGGLLPFRGHGLFGSDEEKLTPWEDVTGYNNYYEFGTGKDDPARNATRFRSRPWKVEVAGEVKRPAVYDFDELLKPFTPAERVYRMRCVEGWSMVVPWLGIPLDAVIDRLEPTSKAKYVEFTTLFDPQQMPGQQRRILDWP